MCLVPSPCMGGGTWGTFCVGVWESGRGLVTETGRSFFLSHIFSAPPPSVAPRRLYFALLRASPMMMVELADECAARAGLPPSEAMLAGAAPLPP